jgi:hypothetical protein
VDLPAPRSPISAIRSLRCLREHLRERDARALQRRLVASLQQFADQQPFRRRRRFIADHFRERTVQRGRDLPQHQHGRVADARLQVREMPLRQPCFGRQRLARHAAARAQQPHAFAHRRQERVALFALGFRRIVVGTAVR